jgi:hypothetical protein
MDTGTPHTVGVLAAALSVHEAAAFGGDFSAGLCGDGLSR